MINLNFDIELAKSCGELRQPESVLKELGISWQESIPRTIAYKWWFFGCENVPDNIPPYITEIGQ